MKYVSKLFLGFFFMSLTSAVAGCGHPVQFGLTNTGQSFKQTTSNFNNQVDILWVVDNSGSMSPFQQNLTNNFNSFISGFQQQGYDFRIAVTTTDAYKADPNLNGYSPSNAGLSKFRDGTGSNNTGVFVIIPTTPNLDQTFVTNASQGSNGSGDERAFSSFKSALNDPANGGFLRSTSFFAAIILSDEDDFSSEQRVEGSWTLNTTDPNYAADHDYNYANLDTVQRYVDYLDVLTGTTGAFRRYNVSSIAVLDSTCQQQHAAQSSSTIIGQRYMQLTNATNGVLGNICDTSFANSLSLIAAQIATLSTQFFLSVVPDPTTIQVFVNGVLLAGDPVNGWTYNSTANSIMFHGTGIPAQGANIGVNFIPAQANH